LVFDKPFGGNQSGKNLRMANGASTVGIIPSVGLAKLKRMPSTRSIGNRKKLSINLIIAVIVFISNFSKFEIDLL